MQFSAPVGFPEVKSDAFSVSCGARTVPTNPCGTNIARRKISKSLASSQYPRTKRSPEACNNDCES